jgi:hypothetical protein
MRLRSRFGLVVPLLVVVVGCGSRPLRGEEGNPRAVILSTASLDAQSAALMSALSERGYDVSRKSTTIVRDKTSAAVYDVRKHPERVDEVSGVLKEVGLGFAEVLPFMQHATGGNIVVVWLGTDAAAR